MVQKKSTSTRASIWNTFWIWTCPFRLTREWKLNWRVLQSDKLIHYPSARWRISRAARRRGIRTRYPKLSLQRIDHKTHRSKNHGHRHKRSKLRCEVRNIPIRDISIRSLDRCQLQPPVQLPPDLTPFHRSTAHWIGCQGNQQQLSRNFSVTRSVDIFKSLPTNLFRSHNQTGNCSIKLVFRQITR